MPLHSGPDIPDPTAPARPVHEVYTIHGQHAEAMRATYPILEPDDDPIPNDVIGHAGTVYLPPAEGEPAAVRVYSPDGPTVTSGGRIGDTRMVAAALRRAARDLEDHAGALRRLADELAKPDGDGFWSRCTWNRAMGVGTNRARWVGQVAGELERLFGVPIKGKEVPGP
jgi:hypothetical protein